MGWSGTTSLPSAPIVMGLPFGRRRKGLAHGDGASITSRWACRCRRPSRGPYLRPCRAGSCPNPWPFVSTTAKLIAEALPEGIAVVGPACDARFGLGAVDVDVRLILGLVRGDDVRPARVAADVVDLPAALGEALPYSRLDVRAFRACERIAKGAARGGGRGASAEEERGEEDGGSHGADSNPRALGTRSMRGGSLAQVPSGHDGSAHRAVALVDVDDRAGDSAPERRAEERGDVPDLARAKGLGKW